MGCAALALAAFGIHFSFVCVEPSSVFRQAVSSCFSNVLHFAHVPTFQPEHLPDGWRNFRFWLILVVGNARCSGPGANSVHHARRVANACSKIWSSACVWAIREGPCLPVKGCSLCPVGPVVTDAADWGRVSRWQDWFLWCSHRLVAGGFTSAPVEQEVASEARKPVLLSYSGKPWPKKVRFHGRFALKQPNLILPRFQMQSVRRADMRDLAPDVAARFVADGCKFPPLAYAEDALLWTGAVWRCLLPSEKAQLHGLPSDVIKAIVVPDCLEAAQASAIADSAHMPSLALLLSRVLQCVNLMPAPVAPLCPADERRLRQSVRGTVFEPGLVESFPGIMTAAQLAHGLVLRYQQHDLHFKRSVNDLVSALAPVPLANLQAYWVDTQLRGKQPAPQGMDWAQQRQVATSAVAVGFQRGSGASRFALPPLHPSGLTKEEHMAASAVIASPFDVQCPLDDDLQFACRAIACMGPAIREWRAAQMRCLTKLSKCLAPWERDLVQMMPPSVAKVAADKRPFFMLVCSLLLRWPDETNPLRFVGGFDIVGDIEVSGLFRPLQVNESSLVGLPALLGPQADDNLSRMFRRVRPGTHDEDLRRLTLEEVELGFADGPFDLSQMNEMFGQSQWRPLERFIHVQACGKLRCIDSGKKPGHNAASRERETIFTYTVDVVPAIMREVMRLATEIDADNPCKQLHFVIGTEDMENAYRQCPINPAHRCCSCVAFWDCTSESVKFIVLNGLPFGLSSAVLAFNRTPALLSSVARRCCAAPAVFFFDDTGVVDVSFAQGSAQAAVRLVYALAGAQLDPDKSQPPAQCRTFLGLSVNVGDNQMCKFDLKPGFREQTQDFINEILSDGYLTSGHAAKLRGKFGWAASGTYGKCGRGGQAALVHRQYFDCSEALSASLIDSLLFHRQLASLVPPRVVSLQPSRSKPVRLYSDASFDPAKSSDVARLGFVIFPDDGRAPPIGMSADIPADLLQLLVDREQQITPCEALLGVVVPYNVRDFLAQKDVIWYIDNQAACQALVKGSSSQSDLCSIATITHLVLAKLGCRVYFEYVESEANIADGLSRGGLNDAWTLRQGWILQHATIPSILYVAFRSLHEAMLLV